MVDSIVDMVLSMTMAAKTVPGLFEVQDDCKVPV